MSRSFYFLPLAALLISCATKTPINTSQGINEKGWFCYQAPNALDVPGQVFRVDDNGVKFREANYSSNITVESAMIVDSSFVQNKAITADLLGNILAVPEGSKASVFGNLSSTRNVAIEIKDRRLSFAGLDDTQYIKGKFLNLLNAGGYEEESKYYVIRETISAKNINIKFDKSFIVGAGAEAELKRVVDGNTSISRVSDETYQVAQSLQEFATVCMKPMKLAVSKEFLSGYGGVPSYRVELEEPTEEILFTSSAR